MLSPDQTSSSISLIHSHTHQTATTNPTDEALTVLTSMTQAGKANVLAFNMALKACEKTGDAARALELLEGMEGAGCVLYLFYVCVSVYMYILFMYVYIHDACLLRLCCLLLIVDQSLTYKYAAGCNRTLSPSTPPSAPAPRASGPRTLR